MLDEWVYRALSALAGESIEIPDKCSCSCHAEILR